MQVDSLLNEVNELLDPNIVTQEVAHCIQDFVVDLFVQQLTKLSTASNHTGICKKAMLRFGEHYNIL